MVFVRLFGNKHNDGTLLQNKALKQSPPVDLKVSSKNVVACSLMSCSSLGFTPVTKDSNGDPKLSLEMCQTV